MWCNYPSSIKCEYKYKEFSEVPLVTFRLTYGHYYLTAYELPYIYANSIGQSVQRSYPYNANFKVTKKKLEIIFNNFINNIRRYELIYWRVEGY